MSNSIKEKYFKISSLKVYYKRVGNSKSIFLKLVYPLVSKIRARWIWTRGSRFFIYGKLDPVKVAWISEKEKHQFTTRTIAERMGVSSVWVKKLCGGIGLMVGYLNSRSLVGDALKLQMKRRNSSMTPTPSMKLTR